jgi:hypothetical protein
MSTFYSAAVKATAAKKVGALLGVSADEVFARPAKPAPEAEVADTVLESAAEHVVEVEDMEELAVPEAVVNVVQPVDALVEAVAVNEPAALIEPAAAEAKSNTSLWLIAALFAAALAVAVYLQPKEEPAAEPAPPLQVVPSDADAAASAVEPSAASVAIKAEPVVAVVPVAPASKAAP